MPRRRPESAPRRRATWVCIAPLLLLLVAADQPARAAVDSGVKKRSAGTLGVRNRPGKRSGRQNSGRPRPRGGKNRIRRRRAWTTKQRLLQNLGQITARALGRGRLKLKIHRAASYRHPDGPAIYVANHPTSVDPLLAAAAIEGPVTIMITGAMFDVPAIGKYLRASGHVPVYKDDRYQRGQALNDARQALEAGRSVLFFSEGQLSPSASEMAELSSGAVLLAAERGVPIIPLGIRIAEDGILKISKTMDVRGVEQEVVSKFPVKGPYEIFVAEAWEPHREIAAQQRKAGASGHKTGPDYRALTQQGLRSRLDRARAGDL